MENKKLRDKLSETFKLVINNSDSKEFCVFIDSKYQEALNKDPEATYAICTKESNIKLPKQCSSYTTAGCTFILMWTHGLGIENTIIYNKIE